MRGRKYTDWTKELCHDLSITCVNRTQFHTLHSAAYRAARKNGWLDEICSHMVKNVESSIGWTKEDYHAETKLYSTRKEHRADHPSRQATIYKNGWDKELFSHMIELPKHVIKWDTGSVREVASKCETRWQFQSDHNGAYTYAKRNGLLDSICGHMPHGNVGKQVKYSTDNIRNEALKYDTRTKFAHGSKRHYAAAQRRGIIDEVCAHMKK